MDKWLSQDSCILGIRWVNVQLVLNNFLFLRDISPAVCHSLRNSIGILVVVWYLIYMVPNNSVSDWGGEGGGVNFARYISPFHFTSIVLPFPFFPLPFHQPGHWHCQLFNFFFLLVRYIYFFKKSLSGFISPQYPLKTFCFVESLSLSNLRSFACRLGRHADQVPVLYHYPRLCIIRPDDHQHAAFYPPVEELQALGTRVQTRLDQINSQQIIKFAKDYMKDPATAVVKTEYF